MILMNPKKWGVALGAGLLATVALLPHAEAELVFEDGGTSSAVTAPAGSSGPAVSDRSDMREALGASQKVQVTLQANPQAAAHPVALAQSESGASSTAETQNYSKTELMRRERQREEIKNEDILQERLEELRLRDERRRTDELLAKGAKSDDASMGTPAPAVSATAVAVAPLKEEVVGTLAPSVSPPSSVAVASAGSAAPAVSEGSLHAASEAPASDRTMFTISPRAGISNMTSSAGFSVNPRFSGGIAGAISASENISFEAGWMYSEFGVGVAPTNPYVAYAQQFTAYSGNNETVAMKQNVFDAGLKLHFLGTDSRVRPFIGAGGGYSRSFINYDQRILSMLSQFNYNGSADYQVSQFLGYLSAGLDVRVTKNVTVGANFKYSVPFSSRESSSLNPVTMYGMNPYFNPGLASFYQDADKRFAGGSLAQSSFYSILGTVSFTF